MLSTWRFVKFWSRFGFFDPMNLPFEFILLWLYSSICLLRPDSIMKEIVSDGWMCSFSNDCYFSVSNIKWQLIIIYYVKFFSLTFLRCQFVENSCKSFQDKLSLAHAFISSCVQYIYVRCFTFKVQWSDKLFLTSVNNSLSLLALQM